MPTDNGEGEVPNPYKHLDPSARNWSEVLESDPYTCWEYLIKLFSSMNSRELELQRESFKKARMQAKEVRDNAKTQEGNRAANDIFEIMLICERAAGQAPPHSSE